MSRIFWFAAGVATGVYASNKIRQTVRPYTPAAWAETATTLLEEAAAYVRDLATSGGQAPSGGADAARPAFSAPTIGNADRRGRGRREAAPTPATAESPMYPETAVSAPRPARPEPQSGSRRIEMMRPQAMRSETAFPSSTPSRGERVGRLFLNRDRTQ